MIGQLVNWKAINPYKLETMLEEQVNCEEYGRKWSWPNLRYYPGIFLKGCQYLG
jgi:hypothetical protein